MLNYYEVPHLIYLFELTSDPKERGQMVDISRLESDGIAYLHEYVQRSEAYMELAQFGGEDVFCDPEETEAIMQASFNTMLRKDNQLLILIKYKDTKEERWEVIDNELN